MQDLNWNDLRYLLALARARTLAAAARQLGVDAPTVARRLHAAESALAGRIFERLPGGRLRPTQLGGDVIRHAEAAEVAVTALIGTAGDADAAPAGRVRLTAVPVLAGRILVPAAAPLIRRYPALRLDLSEPRDLSLTRRETDIALRFARPNPDAGRALLTRKLGRLAYAVYAPAICDPGGDAALPWVCYDEAMATLPPARWLTMAARLQGGANIVVNDAEAIIQAIRAGLVRALDPSLCGGR